MIPNKLTLILGLVLVACGLTLDSCSSQNIGSGKTSSQYMSNGECKDTCMSDGYAVAILQGYDCWCSNYLPGDTTSMSNCNEDCPGYPSEKCAGLGYYGYLVVGDPSGTQGSSSPSSTSESSSSTETTSSSTSKTSSSTSTSSTATTTSSSSTSSTSSRRTSTSTTSTYSSSSSSSSTWVEPTTSSSSSSWDEPTASPSSSSAWDEATESSSSSSSPSSSWFSSSQASSSSFSSSSSPSSASSAPQTTSSSSKSSSSSETHKATTVFSVKTVNGNPTEIVRTQYVTDSPSSTENSDSTSSPGPSNEAVADENKSKESNSFFDSTGKVAGTFTAVGVVVFGLLLAIVYCCFKKSHDYADEENQYSSDEYSLNNEKAMMPAVIPDSKNSSTVSSNLKRDNSNKSIFSYFTAANNSNSGVTRSSSRKKLTKHSRNDLVQSHDPILGGQLMFPITEFDSRLDPNTMFMNNNESKKSFGDENDYSRKILTVANPE